MQILSILPHFYKDAHVVDSAGSVHPPTHYAVLSTWTRSRYHHRIDGVIRLRVTVF